MTGVSGTEAMHDQEGPSLKDQFLTFGKIGVLSFGGPAAQISLMHSVLVEEKKWLSERQYLNALSFCMLLPGPEAMQLATYSGWRLSGIRGGLIAGLLFVLPGALVVAFLATIYAHVGNVPLVEALFTGVKAAVLVIVLQALLKIAGKALKHLDAWVLAGLSFIAIFFLLLPFPLIVLAAAFYGFWRGGEGDQGEPAAITTSWRHTAGIVLIGLLVWFLPILLLDAVFEIGLLQQLGLFFSKLAVVTFGGAYAVLAYMAQDVVTQFGWLTAGEMMDGLGLAETTPGPLILVTEFVAFLAAFKQGGLTLAFGGAIVALWATFVPCFIWIFSGAPYIEWLCAQPRLNGALQAITAAVVGVILNLTIWFGLHVVFQNVTLQQQGWFTLWLPDFGSVDWRVLVLTPLCALLFWRLGVGMFLLLILAALGGLGLSFIN